jgi:hypothetical protein
MNNLELQVLIYVFLPFLYHGYKKYKNKTQIIIRIFLMVFLYKMNMWIPFIAVWTSIDIYLYLSYDTIQNGNIFPDKLPLYNLGNPLVASVSTLIDIKEINNGSKMVTRKSLLISMLIGLFIIGFFVLKSLIL